MTNMEDDVDTRDFKGVWIPKEIYLNKELNWTDKMLLVEIDSLDTEEHCFASNEYFAEFLGVSIRAVSASVAKLKELGYIEQIYFDGRKRGLKSNLSTKLCTTEKKTSRETRSKLPCRHEVDFHHNNIFNNIFNNNKKNIGKFEVNDSFKIDNIGDEIKIYRKELGTIVDEVEQWIIKTKKGKMIDKHFVCRQFTTFAKRQGKM